MPVLTLSDRNFERSLQRSAALVLLSSGGDKLRGDFKTAFNKAADEEADITFAQLDPASNPKTARQYDYQGRALLIGLYRGEVLWRRSRPWSSDLPDYISQLQAKLEADAPPRRKLLSRQKRKKDRALLRKPLDVKEADFEKEVILASHKLPVLVDFWAEWCGPCKAVAPILDKLAAEFAGKLRVVKVDTDKNPAISQAMQVRSIPTIAVFKAGQLVFIQPGALPEASLRDLIQQVIALDVPAAGTGARA